MKTNKKAIMNTKAVKLWIKESYYVHKGSHVLREIPNIPYTGDRELLKFYEHATKVFDQFIQNCTP